MRSLWSETEVSALHEGIAKHGHGSWSAIAKEAELSATVLKGRSHTNLKDKWRQMQKTEATSAARKRSAEDMTGLVDDAAAAVEVVDDWVQCDCCAQWRRLPPGQAAPEETESWMCSMIPGGSCEAEADSAPTPSPAKRLKPSGGISGSRSRYTEEDDEALVRFVAQRAGTLRTITGGKSRAKQIIELKVSGTLLWKEAETEEVTPSHSWQSMKAHYQKHLAPALAAAHARAGINPSTAPLKDLASTIKSIHAAAAPPPKQPRHGSSPKSASHRSSPKADRARRPAALKRMAGVAAAAALESICHEGAGAAADEEPVAVCMQEDAVLEQDWVQCDGCAKWRLLPIGAPLPDEDEQWMCSSLPGCSCSMPEQTEEEVRRGLAAGESSMQADDAEDDDNAEEDAVASAMAGLSALAAASGAWSAAESAAESGLRSLSENNMSTGTMSSSKSCDSKASSFEAAAAHREPKRHVLVVEEPSGVAAHSSGSCKNAGCDESPAAECDEHAYGCDSGAWGVGAVSKPHKAQWLERYQQDQEELEAAAHGIRLMAEGCLAEVECSSPASSHGVVDETGGTVWLQPLKQRMKGMLMGMPGRRQ